jgi:L-seryl-tRNA(Ser) seleniumtransferase
MGDEAMVDIASCQSQIGSGSLPTERLPSQALVIRPAGARRAGASLNRIAALFRALPVPVIGRIQDDAFWLDLRCLEAGDETAFLAQLDKLALRKGARP